MMAKRKKATTTAAHPNSHRSMNFRRRRRTLWTLLLLSVPATAFAPQNSIGPRRRSALSSEAAPSSRTWDQTRHKQVYYGEKPEEDPSPPMITREKIKTKPMPIEGYDAREICETYDRRPFQVGWRMNSVGLPLLGRSIMLFCDGRKQKIRILIQSTRV